MGIKSRFIQNSWFDWWIKVRSQCISFWVHLELFLLLSLQLWKTEPAKQKSQRERETWSKWLPKWRKMTVTLFPVPAACTHRIWAVCPGNHPIHHPGDASLLAAMRQHLPHSLTGCHAVCRSQLLLHSPLFGRTRKHRNRGAAGKHLGCHMVLATGEHQPETMTGMRGN